MLGSEETGAAHLPRSGVLDAAKELEKLGKREAEARGRVEQLQGKVAQAAYQERTPEEIKAAGERRGGRGALGGGPGARPAAACGGRRVLQPACYIGSVACSMRMAAAIARPRRARTCALVAACPTSPFLRPLRPQTWSGW